MFIMVLWFYTVVTYQMDCGEDLIYMRTEIIIFMTKILLGLILVFIQTTHFIGQMFIQLLIILDMKFGLSITQPHQLLQDQVYTMLEYIQKRMLVGFYIRLVQQLPLCREFRYPGILQMECGIE